MAEVVLALRVALSLGVVLLALWGLAKWYERRSSGTVVASRATGTTGTTGNSRAARGLAGLAGLFGAPSDSGRPVRRPLQVIARAPLSRHTSVALLDVGGRTLVVGVGEQQLTLLADLPSDAADPVDAIVAPDSLGDGSPLISLPADPARPALGSAAAQLMLGLRRAKTALPGMRGSVAYEVAEVADAADVVDVVDVAEPVDVAEEADVVDAKDAVNVRAHGLPVAADSLGSPVVTLRAVPDAPAALDSLGTAAPILSRRLRAERERAMRLHPAGKALQVAAGTLPALDENSHDADAGGGVNGRDTSGLNPGGLNAPGLAESGLDNAGRSVAERETADPFAAILAAASPAQTFDAPASPARLTDPVPFATRQQRAASTRPLAGSVLDPQSWSQAAEVLRSLRKAQ